ncbi:DUF368 domain-containing protein [Streptomyces durbertensis]|uniref:DUF368 domain-containing protein n=1 Tax=Streptomyces durbertensis TaxID=2448886 RepID=A0ABR6EJU7_9ACTN|nr:DUF368 domain-containing protein [Streptomyces durbertensis]MBB1245605.1 DUF368 domain-containing protein [Streptomyces durbertensis]
MSTTTNTSVGARAFNVFRGALIGVVEVVPGVSGGTVALIIGAYEKLIGGAGHITTAIRYAASDLPRRRGATRARDELRNVDWPVVVPMLIGMACALVLGAKLVAPLVESHQQYAFALFLGLVLASVWVPYSHSGQRWKAGNYLLAGAVGVAAFVVTGLPPSETSGNPLTLFLGGSVAICALVLPGLSGSFILLTMGLYQPVIDAANSRDLGLLAAFGLGCMVGLAVFVKLLKWLLENYHHTTLVVMTGLMAGSLRALWPWQDDDRNMYAPGDGVPLTFSLMALGFVIVAVSIIVEMRLKRARERAAGGPGNPPAQRRRRHARV